MMRLHLRFILFLFFGSHLSAVAQERTITGKVTSKEDGQAVPGVNVVVQGTARGTTTNADGSFSLAVEPADNVLLFSFIGYKTQVIPLGTLTNLDVILESEATSLQEVVVVGYGVQKKT